MVPSLVVLLSCATVIISSSFSSNIIPNNFDENFLAENEYSGWVINFKILKNIKLYPVQQSRRKLHSAVEFRARGQEVKRSTSGAIADQPDPSSDHEPSGADVHLSAIASGPVTDECTDAAILEFSRRTEETGNQGGATGTVIGTEGSQTQFRQLGSEPWLSDQWMVRHAPNHGHGHGHNRTQSNIFISCRHRLVDR